MSGAVEGVALLPEPEDLRPWGYAPGSYVFKCQDCPPDLSMYDRMGKLGDKRAWRCREHAIMARDAAPAISGPRTTPPARSYADGVWDSADLALKHAAPKDFPQSDYDDACRDIAAAIRLLPQGGKA